MKLRASTLVVALTLSTIAPYTVAQVMQKPGDPSTTTTQTTPTQTSPTQTTQTQSTTTTQKPSDSQKQSDPGVAPKGTTAQDIQNASKNANLDEPVPMVSNPPKETHDGGKNDI